MAAHLLSLPFAFAPAAMLVVIAYALVMRGEPVLRAWLLVHFLGLLPYSVTMMLSPSLTSEETADALFRISAAFIPLSAAAGAGFQFRLLGKHRQARWFVWLGVTIATVWIVLGATSHAVVTGVRWIPLGLWYAEAGSWAPVGLLVTIMLATPGFFVLATHVLAMPPSAERRQMTLVLAANLVTYTGLVDVAIAYDVPLFPLGWLLSGVGSVLVARALVVENLLRVRAIDPMLPRLVLHLAGAILLGWVIVELVGPQAPWWLTTFVLATAFASIRATFPVLGLVTRGARSSESTLDRLLTQLVSRARPLEGESEIARLAGDVIELGVGAHVDILLAAADDYGWSTVDGIRIPDDSAPDPLLGAWLVERPQLLFGGQLAEIPDDLQKLVTTLMEKRQARALVPVVSADELLALVLVPSESRRLSRREIAFVERASERLGEALVHARMAQQAAERATMAREVELAATLQQQLLPGKGPHVHGDITIVGSWFPATRCAGDFWGVHSLGSRGVLVAIGDVTGHGVASATVTAAATSAVDVIVRRAGESLELTDLVTAVDKAVLRVGGGQLTMTCFAAILDAKTHEIQFVSCGHTTPYVCRTSERGDLELQALVGRGNPLGTGTASPKIHRRPLHAGDLVVWYTDGVIEAQDASGEPFGDRRLQRMLRRIDRAHRTPAALHDAVHASVTAHRGGQPRGDDETLVVAQWSPQQEVTS